MSGVLQAALRFRRLGVAVHWLRPKEKIPIEKGWAALGALTEEELERTFRPGFNLGIHTGLVKGAQYPLVGVDLDNEAALIWAKENLPPTPWRTITAKGEHWLYLHPGEGHVLPNKAHVGAMAIDIRGDGGNLVAPFSIHPNGHVYVEAEPWQGIPPVFEPTWFPAPVLPPPPPIARTITLLDEYEYVMRRAEKWLAEVPGAVSGQGGDNQTWTVALGLVRGFVLRPTDAWYLLTQYNQRCSPPWNEKALRHKLEMAQRANRVAEGYLRDTDRPDFISPSQGAFRQPPSEIFSDATTDALASDPPTLPPVPEPTSPLEEAEEAVLGALLENARLLDRISVLDSGRFSDRLRGALHRVMVTLDVDRKPFDPILIANELQKIGAALLFAARGGAGYLDQLRTKASNADSLEHHAELIQEAARLRQLVAIGETTARLAQSGQPAARIIERVQEQIVAVSGQQSQSTVQTARQAAHTAIKKIEALYTNGTALHGLSCGMERVDERLGGLAMGEVSVIGGRPSHGKSSLALSIAYDVAVRQRIPVFFMSIEMTMLDVVRRWLSAHGPIDAGRLKVARMEQVEWARLSRTAANLAEAPLWIDEPSDPTLAEIRAKARRWRSDPDLFEIRPEGLIVIDYVQLINTIGLLQSKTSNRDQELGIVSRGIKALAKTLGVHITILAALNREAQRVGRPNKSHLRECGSLESDADVIIFPYRPGADNKQLPQDYTEIIIDKNRNGDTGIINVTWEGRYTRFIDKEPPPLSDEQQRGRR